MADNDAAFQQSVRQALQALQQTVQLMALAQARPLPTPANVTEIVIRTGPADAVAAMGTGGAAGGPPPPSGPGPAATAGPAAAPSARTACICIGALIQNLDQLPFTANEIAWIDSLIPEGNTREDVIHALLARVIGERAPGGLTSQAPDFQQQAANNQSGGTAKPPPGETGATGTRPPPTEGAASNPAPEAPPAGGQGTARRTRRQ